MGAGGPEVGGCQAPKLKESDLANKDNHQKKKKKKKGGVPLGDSHPLWDSRGTTIRRKASDRDGKKRTRNS